MITIDDIVGGILRREGGYSDRAADKGGPTNMGITLATLAAWRGRPCTSADVAGLTEKEARAIYVQRYVAPYATVPDPLRALLVDIAVTSWHDDAARMLQRVLARLGAYQGAIDGKAGPATWAALRSWLQRNPDGIRRLFVGVLKERSRQLLDEALDDAQTRAFLTAHPSVDLHNARGWNNRVLDFLDELV